MPTEIGALRTVMMSRQKIQQKKQKQNVGVLKSQNCKDRP